MFEFRVALWKFAVIPAILIVSAIASVRYSALYFFAGIVVAWVVDRYVLRMLTRCPHCHALLGRFRNMTWAQRSLATSLWVTIEKPAAKCDRCGTTIE